MPSLVEQIQTKAQQTFFQYSFEPLEITFTLNTPVLLSFPWINFDGLIARFQYQDVLEEVFDLLPRRQVVPELEAIPLPVKKVTFTSNGKADYFYDCSISEFADNATIGTIALNKTFHASEAAHYVSRLKYIQKSRGQYKLYHMQLPTNYSSSVTFRCIGDYPRLNYLLSKIRHLGKKTGSGFGEINRYTITQKDFSHAYCEGPRVLRPIPKTFFPNPASWHLEVNTMSNLSYKPPYWAAANTAICVTKRSE
jgi:hypothetical protein